MDKQKRNNRPNKSKAVRSLLKAKSVESFNSFDRAVSDFTVQDRQFTRMSWDMNTEEIRMSYAQLANVFLPDGDGHKCDFFLDNNLFGGESKPESFWDVLLNHRIVLTPLIWDEMSDWIENPHCDEYIHDVVKDSSSDSIDLLDYYQEPPPWHLAFMYYSYLLSVRQTIKRMIESDFVMEHKRPTTVDEQTKLIQKWAAPHEVQLIKKAFATTPSVTDEELVASAVVSAIANNRQTIILTRDHDVQLHFRKMMELIDIQYQAMLFAAQIAEDRQKFRLHRIARSNEVLQKLSNSDPLLVKKPCTGRDFVEMLLPAEYQPIRVGCIFLGGQGDDLCCSFLSYVAETGMNNLLNVKQNGWERNGRPVWGLNTDRLDGLNCHITGMPVGILNPNEHAIILDENTDNWRIPLLDKEHAGSDRRLGKN